MTRNLFTRFLAGMVLATLVGGPLASSLRAKEKQESMSPNDPTLKLFQLLQADYGGKLPDYYILADIYPDPVNTLQQLQRVVRVKYDKDLQFGKLRIYVRSVAKMQPDQQKLYTPKSVYEFGVEDSEKFVKSEPGPLGRQGDLYLRSTAEHPLQTTPVTDEARKTYEHVVADYLLPALQKKQQ